MKYNQKIIAKNGQEILIRNAEASDGEAVLENFNLIHAETDYLLSYPGEIGFDVEQESRFLERRADSQKLNCWHWWMEKLLERLELARLEQNIK